MYTMKFKPATYEDLKVGSRIIGKSGRKGTVLFVKPGVGELLIEYDESFPNGHDGNNVFGFGCGDKGRCWWHSPGDVSLLKNEYEVDLL